MTVRLGGVVITNPSKPFWPDDGLTKLDLAQFYARIASQILPWLKGRPVTMERCPDGIRKNCFYQKQAPANLPDGVPTMSLPAPTAHARRGLHHRRQPENAAHARQLRLHRDACDEQPDRSPRPARLARLRSGSVGRIRVRRARGAAAPRSSRGSRAGVVSQDLRWPRASRVRAAQARRAAGSGARVRRGDCARTGGAASQDSSPSKRGKPDGARPSISTSCATPPDRLSCRRSRCGGSRLPRSRCRSAGTKSARGSTPASSISEPPSAGWPESRRGRGSSAIGRRCRGFRPARGSAFAARSRKACCSQSTASLL